MNLRRSTVSTALTAALIFTMGFLPFAVSGMRERNAQGNAAYAEITPVELKIDNSSIWQRIMLLSMDNKTYEITPDRASINKADLPNYILDGLQPYIDCGVLPLVPDPETHMESVTCYMAYSPSNDQAAGAIFWEVTLYDKETDTQLALVLDDHSGKILTLNYAITDYYGRATYPGHELLRLFMNTFLAEVGDSRQLSKVLDKDSFGTTYHTTITVEHPDLSESVLLFFLAEENGLSMHIQSYHDAIGYDASYSK